MLLSAIRKPPSAVAATPKGALSLAAVEAAMLSNSRSFFIFFLISRRVVSEPDSGAYAMLIMPEAQPETPVWNYPPAGPTPPQD